MFKSPSRDPGIIAFSTIIYRLLLRFYPPHFRQAYMSHMLQVFRDYCLKTYRQSGPPGMLMLWALTLFDWFKTVIEEQLNRGTEMTREKFIRLSGWGMMLGAVAMALSFYVMDTDTLRLWMYRTLGVPGTPASFETYRLIYENLGGMLLLATILLLAMGMVGLRLRYGKPSGALGNNSLVISILGGEVAGAAFLIGALTPWDGWFVMWWGLAVLFAGLAVFGIATLQTKSLPRWNGLPVVAGVGFPLLTVIALIYETIQGYSWQPDDWVLNIMLSITWGGLIFLGYALQSDAPCEEAA